MTTKAEIVAALQELTETIRYYYQPGEIPGEDPIIIATQNAERVIRHQHDARRQQKLDWYHRNKDALNERRRAPGTPRTSSRSLPDGPA